MNKTNINEESIKGIAALLVHVANIDEAYTDKEKKIIKDFIASFSYNESDVEEVLKEAEQLESDSIQLLSFTNLVKKESLELKTEIMKTYNDKNIKKIVSLIEKYGTRTKSNLIWRGSKLNINENEVINAIKLLLDLKVINEKKEITGDGWNTRGTRKVYELV